MKKVTISIGLANRDGVPIQSEVPVRQLKARLSNLYGGITTQPTEGGWVNEEGKILLEDGLLITIYTEEAHQDTVTRILKRFIKATDQESVLLVVEDTQAQVSFIGA